jgi:hypothetical protein
VAECVNNGINDAIGGKLFHSSRPHGSAVHCLRIPQGVQIGGQCLLVDHIGHALATGRQTIHQVTHLIA